MQHWSLVLVIGSLLFAGLLPGCTEPEASRRIGTNLGSDGYALFRVDGERAERVAVIIEMRDAAPGTYVLLHTEDAPQSSGWFALDTDSLATCRWYGKEAVDRVELDCLVPDGRGKLVDLVTIDAGMILLPPEDGAKAVPQRPRTTLMRHEMCGCEGCCSDSRSESSRSDSSTSSVSEPRTSRSGYYAVMRLEGGLTKSSSVPASVPIAIEVRSLDDDDNHGEPTVRQIQ